MAIKISDGLRNFLMKGGSFRHAFSGGELRIFSGAQAADANAAEPSGLICTITDTNGSRTAETRATGSVQITGGSSGNVSNVTIGGIDVLGDAVAWTTSNDATATAVAAQINLNPFNYLVDATVATDTVTLTARPGIGAAINSAAVAAATTGDVTDTPTNMSSGVTPENGLSFEQEPTAGVLEKLASQTWSGAAVSTGTAASFRLVGAVSDAGSLDSGAVYFRLDGTVGTSGADINFTSVSFVDTETQSIPTFSVTEPAS